MGLVVELAVSGKGLHSTTLENVSNLNDSDSMILSHLWKSKRLGSGNLGHFLLASVKQPKDIVRADPEA